MCLVTVKRGTARTDRTGVEPHRVEPWTLQCGDAPRQAAALYSLYLVVKRWSGPNFWLNSSAKVIDQSRSVQIQSDWGYRDEIDAFLWDTALKTMKHHNEAPQSEIQPK